MAVKGNFKARGAERRSYLYRFANLNQEKLKTVHSDLYHNLLEDSEAHLKSKRLLHKRRRKMYFNQQLPISDVPFFTETHLNFDADKAEEMLHKLVGFHDFKAFSNKEAQVQKFEGSRQKVVMPEEYFQREIDAVTFSKIPPPFSSKLNPIYDLFDFYEFTITASSFYRNQVCYTMTHFTRVQNDEINIFSLQIRRIAGILFQVGGGLLDLDHVDKMLKGEIKEWPQKVRMADPNGLYLYNVEYGQEMMENSTDDVTQLPILPHPDPDLPASKPIEWSEMRPIMTKIFQQSYISN